MLEQGEDPLIDDKSQNIITCLFLQSHTKKMHLDSMRGGPKLDAGQ